jgi:hypothetical protein
MTFFGMALITAIATAVLAAFAFVTAVYARKAFLTQAAQLEHQRREFGYRLDEALRAQASQVIFWTSTRQAFDDAAEDRLAPARAEIAAHIRNTSERPIRSVKIVARHQNGRLPTLWGEADHVDILLPHAQADRTRTVELPDMYVWLDYILGVENLAATFRDADGEEWAITEDGDLWRPRRE